MFSEDDFSDFSALGWFSSKFADAVFPDVSAVKTRIPCSAEEER